MSRGKNASQNQWIRTLHSSEQVSREAIKRFRPSHEYVKRWKKFLLATHRKDVYHTVRNYSTGPRYYDIQRRKRHLQLSLASVPLKVFAMYVISVLWRAENGNLIDFVHTNFYSKLIKPVFTSLTTSTYTATLFLDHWIVPYGIADFPLTKTALNFSINTLILC